MAVARIGRWRSFWLSLRRFLKCGVWRPLPTVGELHAAINGERMTCFGLIRWYEHDNLADAVRHIMANEDEWLRRK